MSLATFPKAREGAAGGVSGEAGGEGVRVLGALVTLGNFVPGRGGEERGLSLAGRESLGAARRRRRGRGALLQRGPRAGLGEGGPPA